MNIPQENHFEHDRIDKLRCINGVNFTAREIDIIACLFNARGTSRTASLLNISPRTVENHVRNLMVKLGCNSREGIIDYIEKNNKHSLFRDHYAHLILGQNFKNTLRAIGKKIANSFSFSLVYWKENKNNYALLEKIKKYLERAGLTIHLEQSENPFSITQLIDEIKEGKHKIYILPDEIWDDVKNIPSLEENSLNHRQTPPNSAFLFMGKKEINNLKI